MRIVAFTQGTGGSALYRTIQPMQALERKGHGVLIREPANIDTAVKRCDVAFIQRFQGRTALQFARNLKKAGLGIVWEHDDDVTGSAGDVPRARESLIAETSAMVRAADVVTTPSAVLAEHFRRLGGKDVTVIENHVPHPPQPERPPREDAVVVGWTAWADHQDDWERLRLRAAMLDVLDRSPRTRVESVGPIDLGLPADRYRRSGPLSYDALLRRVAGFDIGIAPIVDIPFNRARSNVKVKEYASAGVPWLASPIGPYADLGPDQGGQLVENDRWADTIADLAADHEARARQAAQARAWAATQTLEQHAHEWEEALQRAMILARRRRLLRR